MTESNHEPTEENTTQSTDEVQKQVSKLVGSIWKAAGAVVEEPDYASLTAEDVTERLHVAIRSRLSKTHKGLLKTPGLYVPVKRSRTAIDGTSPTAARSWRPTRPEFARSIAQLLADGVGLVEAPIEKRETCKHPIKIFAKTVVAKLMSTSAPLYTDRSIQYAVAEVVAAVVAEAEAMRDEIGAEGSFELHCSTDAAWTGTAARGCGVAMDVAGKTLITAAAVRVGERLAQPELKIAKATR